MAFAYTIETSTEGAEVFGAKKVIWGTYASSSGSTGGDISTGLKRVEFISLQSRGAAVATNAPAVNETLPLNSGAVTIVTDADEEGVWFAIGL